MPGPRRCCALDRSTEELNALRHGCGVFDLGWRGKLVVSGEDRVRWLNGMVTNNTRDLPQDFGNYSFVLNAQGHIQGDLLAFQRGEFYMLESEAGQIAAHPRVLRASSSSWMTWRSATSAASLPRLAWPGRWRWRC